MYSTSAVQGIVDMVQQSADARDGTRILTFSCLQGKIGVNPLACGLMPPEIGVERHTNA